ncbi:IclR family transcriptional regulator [Acidovorax sp. SUPP2522]|uniref:IclR family transcriptional regulator n=1 Tax=unclassified Acidovorax TaxID=2684926 RepID=UPI00234914DB|nr:MULTISPECIES: IclR family transcriptional regulator [unclassified Acidovorax]WCN00023.1 IclR family transcriptional regulator [Acidovorax sp. GBBC 1281]GKT19102.1 IclR family transcriptional regulator [Acidovorax sp. SUPP2522]
MTRSAILPDLPGQSPSNRSLERGIEILRAFRPGSELLGNGDLVERTGLSKATVSRLTQTLVGAGMLQWDPARRAYRLAPAVLSLAHSMRTGSRVLSAAAPLMRALAESRRINVGLAAPDRDEMVYLESIRYNRRIVLRHVVSGQRVPMELTSLGRAYLAVAPAPQRTALLEVFKARRRGQWKAIEREIDDARASVHARNFCAAAWQPEVVALATPLATADAIYVLNCSVSTGDPLEAVVGELHAPLLALRADIVRALQAQAAQEA